MFIKHQCGYQTESFDSDIPVVGGRDNSIVASRECSPGCRGVLASLLFLHLVLEKILDQLFSEVRHKREQVSYLLHSNQINRPELSIDEREEKNKIGTTHPSTGSQSHVQKAAWHENGVHQEVVYTGRWNGQ